MPGETELKVYFLSSLSNIPSSLIWGLMAVLGIGCAILVLRKRGKEKLRACAILLLLEWIFLILCTAVIFRETHADRQCHLLPFWSYVNYQENSYFIEAAAVNVLNTIMFIPVGLLLGVGYDNERRWLSALVVGAGLSVLIELLQFILKRGLCETDDLIHNVFGCLLGYSIFRLTLRLIRYVQTLFQASV